MTLICNLSIKKRIIPYHIRKLILQHFFLSDTYQKIVYFQYFVFRAKCQCRSVTMHARVNSVSTHEQRCSPTPTKQFWEVQKESWQHDSYQHCAVGRGG